MGCGKIRAGLAFLLANERKDIGIFGQSLKGNQRGFETIQSPHGASWTLGGNKITGLDAAVQSGRMERLNHHNLRCIPPNFAGHCRGGTGQSANTGLQEDMAWSRDLSLCFGHEDSIALHQAVAQIAVAWPRAVR